MIDAGESGGSFETALAPWLQIAGVEVAALVTPDGLLVTWAGAQKYDRTAVAAHAASALAVLGGLARELGTAAPAVIKASLPGADIVLSPISSELILFVLATAGALDAVPGDQAAG